MRPAIRLRFAAKFARRRHVRRPLLPLFSRVAAASCCCVFAATAMVFAAQPELAPRAAQPAPTDALPGAADAIPAKVRRYAERLLHRYDANGDGKLQADEWGKMHGNPQAADGNRDRIITLEELTNYIAAFGRNHRMGLANPVIGWDPRSGSGTETGGRPGVTPDGPQPNSPDGVNKTASSDAGVPPAAGKPSAQTTTFYVPKSRLSPGLPDWFLRRDLDGDGQVSLAEFAPNPTQADLEEFARYDRNGDGFITAKECLDVLKPAKPASRKAGGSLDKSKEKKAGGKSSDKKAAAASGS
jgi:hypothetical protein